MTEKQIPAAAIPFSATKSVVGKKNSVNQQLLSINITFVSLIPVFVQTYLVSPPPLATGLMNVCIYVYVDIYVHTDGYLSLYIYIYIYLNMKTKQEYIYIHAYICICLAIYLYINTHTCI